MSKKIRKVLFKFCIFFMTSLIICSMFNANIIAFAKNSQKISTELYKEILQSNSNTEIPIMILGDTLLNSENKSSYRNITSNSSLNYTSNKLNNLTINDIQNNISNQRKHSKEYYESLNATLSKDLNISEKIVYSSSYAPVLFAKLSKNEILRIASNNDVSRIAHCDKTLKLEQELDVSKATTNADTIQNNSTFFGYTGSGIKIGILEKKHTTYLCAMA